MLLAMLSIGGGAGGTKGTGKTDAEPLMELATPANDGMLVAMISVMPARVRETSPRGRGGAFSPAEGDAVMSSLDIS